VGGVLHLPGRQPRRIITCSNDGSLRLWNLESGTQIGEEWRDKEHGTVAVATTMALSPQGDIVASGNSDGTVKLWEVETGKVIAKWKGHAGWVQSVCWSPDGKRVVSGSRRDGMARVWDVKSSKFSLGLKTGHESVHAVSYSPDAKSIATGGYNESGIRIWDSNTGKLLSKIEHVWPVWSLVWTSDQKKIISGTGHGSIMIFDTATSQQIAILEGHTYIVYSITLFHNGRLLSSTSIDGIVHLWNLDTQLEVCPPLWHESNVGCLAFSADGTLLATACDDQNAYVWDIHAIFEKAGLEHLLSMAPEDRLEKKLLLDADSMHRAPRRIPRGFFDDVVQDRVDSFDTSHLHPHPSVHHHRGSLAPSSGFLPHTLLTHVLSLFRHHQPNPDGATELQQLPRSSTTVFHSPDAVEIAAVRDKKALYVARRPERASDKAKRIKNPSRWTRFVLFICCVSTR
jgi:WD40 repeat protein